MAQMFITDISDLKTALKEILIELNQESEKEREKAGSSDKLYTRNQVRKRLGKAHATVSKLILNGLIKTTKNGLISEAAINDFLQKN